MGNEIGDVVYNPGRLVVGQLVRTQGRIWRVGLVNDSRARLDPLTVKYHNVVKGDHGTVEFSSYGDSVNVAPKSVIELVTESQLSHEERTRKLSQESKEKVMSAVAQMPGVTSKAKAAKSAKVSQPAVGANRVANKERVAKLAEKKAEGKEKKEAKPRTEKAVKPCKCGCGEQVTGHFAQGHDARFKGWLLKVERGKMKVSDLPDVVQKTYKWVKRGDGMIPTVNYKGEAHKGYDA